MRARNIKPGFFKNDELAECSYPARILFAGLWCMADRAGRLKDRPKKIKAELLPYDDENVDQLLDELASHEFITRYEVEGKRYIQVDAFCEHQNPHKNERESVLPPMPAGTESVAAPEQYSASTVQEPEQHESDPADSGFLIPDSGSRIPEEMSDVADAPRTPSYEPEHYELAIHLDQRIQEHNPKAKPASSRQLESWANDARLMIQRDEHSPAEIRQVIDWCQENEFWRSNVLSMGKLREQFPRLWSQMQERPTATRSPPRNAPDFSGTRNFRRKIAELEQRRA
jgi:hypothetical protein